MLILLHYFFIFHTFVSLQFARTVQNKNKILNAGYYFLIIFDRSGFMYYMV